MNSEEYARNGLRSILTEEANQSDVIDAIKKKYEVNVTYNDGANGPRRIQPVAYGKTSRGNLVLRAYQPEGASRSATHGWKYFLLDRIVGWDPDKDSHFDRPPEYAGDGEYNPHGDKSMSEVYLTADFGDSQGGDYETGESNGQEKPNNPTPPATNAGSNVSGTNTQPQVSPYANSAKEMGIANNFGTDNAGQTVGPVMKGNTETNTQVSQTKPEDYNNVENNRPIYKGNEEQPQQNDVIDNMQYADDNTADDNEEENL